MEDNKIYLGIDGVIYAEPSGEQTYDRIKEMERVLGVLTQSQKDRRLRQHIFIDFSKLGGHTSEARRAGFELLKSLEFEKLALTCSGLYLKYIALFMVNAAARTTHVRHVESKEEALRWFAESQDPDL